MSILPVRWLSDSVCPPPERATGTGLDAPAARHRGLTLSRH